MMNEKTDDLVYKYKKKAKPLAQQDKLRKILKDYCLIRSVKQASQG